MYGCDLVCLNGGFKQAHIIVFKIEMHDGIGSAQRKG